MLPMRDLSVERERRKDEMANVQRHRLMASVSRKSPLRIREEYRRFLVKLGESLEVLGCQLQSQNIGNGRQAA